jgi:hypothetical protein
MVFGGVGKTKGPRGGCCRWVPRLLVQEQQLPWLLWPAHLVMITQTMFVELAFPPCFRDPGHPVYIFPVLRSYFHWALIWAFQWGRPKSCQVIRIYSDSRDNTISHLVSTVLDNEVFTVLAKYTYTKRDGYYILVMRKFEELVFGRLFMVVLGQFISHNLFYACPWTIDFA